MGEELVGETPQLLGIKNSEGVGRGLLHNSSEFPKAVGCDPD